MSTKDLEKIIISAIRTSLSKSDDLIFENILDCLRVYEEKPCNAISEFKRRTTRAKGYIFEIFCKLYLIAKDFQYVWLLNEVPAEILEKLNLTRNDMGIDIIAFDAYKNGYVAVQCKFKSKSKNKTQNVLGWKSLSTFYALCARTGLNTHKTSDNGVEEKNNFPNAPGGPRLDKPWVQYMIMTNCDYVRRLGKKDKLDYTIAYKSFKNTKHATWLKMVGDTGNSMKTEITIENSQNEERKEPVISWKTIPKNDITAVRNHRADFLEKLMLKK
jgi:hypothetical protein